MSCTGPPLLMVPAKRLARAQQPMMLAVSVIKATLIREISTLLSMVVFSQLCVSLIVSAGFMTYSFGWGWVLYRYPTSAEIKFAASPAGPPLLIMAEVIQATAHKPMMAEDAAMVTAQVLLSSLLVLSVVALSLVMVFVLFIFVSRC